MTSKPRFDLPEDVSDNLRRYHALVEDLYVKDETDKEGLKALKDHLTAEETSLHRSLWLDWVYSDANSKPYQEPVEQGGVKVTFTSHDTGKGHWAYTKAVLTRLETGEEITTIRRNYSVFPFEWITLANATYFVCGFNYQGQTFVNIATGWRKDALSDGAEEGHGFCWSKFNLLGDGATLLVEGCIWACPYEYRFYDVSDIEGKGWVEIPIQGQGYPHLEEDNTTLTYVDGLIQWQRASHKFKATGECWEDIERMKYVLSSAHRKTQHQKAPPEVQAQAQANLEAHRSTYGDPEDNPELWEPTILHTQYYKNTGGEISLVREEKSDWLVKSEAERERQKAEEKQRSDKRKQDSELWLYLQERERSAKLHWSYSSMVSQWEGDPNICSFYVSLKKDPYTLLVVWGEVSGDLTVEFRSSGDVVAKKQYPRSHAGMDRVLNDYTTFVETGTSPTT